MLQSCLLVLLNVFCYDYFFLFHFTKSCFLNSCFLFVYHKIMYRIVLPMFFTYASLSLHFSFNLLLLLFLSAGSNTREWDRRSQVLLCLTCDECRMLFCGFWASLFYMKNCQPSLSLFILFFACFAKHSTFLYFIYRSRVALNVFSPYKKKVRFYDDSHILLCPS